METLDWIIVIAFLFISLSIGLGLKKRAEGSLSDFFLGGRNLPWYIAGISMVATTFAADTPLLVTELVAENGISGNWLWWNMLIGGMLTTFFFAKLWRRAEVLTELEFIELRYSGPLARFLRLFKSVYLGLFLNVIIIGWVNVALLSIIQIFFDIQVDAGTSWYMNPLYQIVAGAMLFVAIYSSLAGLLGVAFTDSIQFVIAMTSTILLAFFVLDTPEIGGMAGLKSQVEGWRFEFFPRMSGGVETLEVLTISVGAFLTYFFVQWWASWYPGGEPGGGGYIAQRMMSAKDEKHAIWASLFFQIAHYALRPWPWIIVALCALVLYPELGPENAKQGFVLVMRDYLPVGLKGLLLVAFLSAYMSTISTQLNWGSSFLTNDLYRRFIRNDASFESEAKAQKSYVRAGRVFTLIIMIVAFAVTLQITTISEAFRFLIEAGAGLGAVLILRWYWWRVNAWSELVASIAPFVAFGINQSFFEWAFPTNVLFSVGFTTVSWLLATFLTKPVDEVVLQNFVDRVRPSGWWGKYGADNSAQWTLVIQWFSGILMTYSALFASGYFIFMEYQKAWMWTGIASAGLLILLWAMRRTKD
jgi:SSS family solute:Na+ symporter